MRRRAPPPRRHVAPTDRPPRVLARDFVHGHVYLRFGDGREGGLARPEDLRPRGAQGSWSGPCTPKGRPRQIARALPRGRARRVHQDEQDYEQVSSPSCAGYKALHSFARLTCSRRPRRFQNHPSGVCPPKRSRPSRGRRRARRRSASSGPRARGLRASA